MVGSFCAHSATILDDGRVLVVGGRQAEAYDPVADHWEAVATPARSHERHTALRLPDGRVLVIGGNRPELTAPEVYVPTSNSWFTPTLTWPGAVTATPTYTWPGATATADSADLGTDHRLLPDGRVLAMGLLDAGYDRQFCDRGNFGWTNARTLIVDTADWAVRAGPILTAHHRNAWSAQLPGGDLVVGGGVSMGWTDVWPTMWHGGGYTLGADRLDVASMEPRAVATPEFLLRGARTTDVGGQTDPLVLPDGRVMVGATNKDYEGCPVPWALNLRQTPPLVYDPFAGTWTLVKGWFQSRTGAVIGLLPGSRVLVVGGQGPRIGIGIGEQFTAEVYDVTADRWLWAGQPDGKPHSVDCSTLTALPDGRLLLVDDGAMLYTFGPPRTTILLPAAYRRE